MTAQSTATDTVIVTSSDTHVSPPLSAYRPYCEKRFLEDFDAYVRDFETGVRDMNDRRSAVAKSREGMPDEAERIAERVPHGSTPGGHGDVHVRLAEMDREGIAAEVVFHGTQGDTRNGMRIGWPIPWSLTERSLIAEPNSSVSVELASAGRRIYNRWLADMCSVEPERHAGLCHIPVWDIEAAIQEVRWAKDNGLKGINFPNPGASFGGLTVDTLNSEYPPYEDEYWDPLFATCAELGMPLTTHVGHPILPPFYKGAATFPIIVFEQMPLGGRNLWHLTFSGVFDRHPDLKLVITEVLGKWIVYTVDNMDSFYFNEREGPGHMLRHAIKRPPRDYVKNNVFFGCSFMSRPEALDAFEADLGDRVMWGSDYPHHESTWHPDTNERPVTPLSLANTLHDLPEDVIRDMAGRNLINCYGLDEAALSKVAERVGPTLDDLSHAPDLSLVPAGYIGMGFRDKGGPFT